MTVGQERLAFLVLVGAFAVSALYQLYRAALMEVLHSMTQYDAFGVAIGAVYLALVGISALVLTDKRWA